MLLWQPQAPGAVAASAWIAESVEKRPVLTNFGVYQGFGISGHEGRLFFYNKFKLL
jgi:hypothetical protein